jgi:hypothetical protein
MTIIFGHVASAYCEEISRHPTALKLRLKASALHFIEDGRKNTDMDQRNVAAGLAKIHRHAPSIIRCQRFIAWQAGE